MNNKAKKLLTVVMCLCMLITSIVPSSYAYADETGKAEQAEGDSVSDKEGAQSFCDVNLAESNEDVNYAASAECENKEDISEGADIPEGTLLTPADETDAGALTMENHSLKWVSGSSKTVIDGDSLTITPSTNQDCSVKAQLIYSCGGNEGVAQGNAEIRLPLYVYYNRDGEPVGQVELSVPKAPATGGATSFNYYIDDHGTTDDKSDDEIVITNYKDLQPGGFFMKADIVWKFNAIDVSNGFSNDDIKASFSTQGTGGGDALTADSQKLTTTVNTGVSVKEPAKNAKDKKENWQSEWGPKPEDADDFYYVVWSLHQRVDSTYTTSPYTVTFEELPGAVDKTGNTKDGDENKGEVVAWSNYCFYGNGAPTAYGSGKDTDFKQGTKEEMESDPVVTNTTYSQVSSVRAYAGRDVVMRYPKANIPAEGQTPTIYNGFKATVTTPEGEITEKVALDSYIYQRVSLDVNYPGDMISMYKRQNAGLTDSNSKYACTYSGALNLLRAGKEVEADWSIDVKNMSWTRTENGTKTYDTVLRDGMMYVAGERLQPEDYELSRFYPAQYDVYLPAYNEDIGFFLAVSGEYEEKYAPIKVEIKDAAGNWSEYGSIYKTGANSYRWEGNDGTVTTGTYTSNTLSSNKDVAVTLPSGTQDIRFTHTDKAYGVEYRMGLYYKLKPSEHLMGLIGDDTSKFNLININEAWGAQEDAEGNSSIYTLGNSFNNTSTPTIKADVENSDIAEFGGTTEVLHDYAEHAFTAINGTGNFYKTISTPVNEPDKLRVRIPVSFTWDYYYNYKNLGVSIQDAAAAGIINESREGDFYDLLPPGVDVDLSSITVRTYCNTNIDKQTVPPCDYTVEMVDNWRDSGRTMMIIHAKVPEGYANIADNATYFNTGYRVGYTMYDSWDNIETNGIGLENNVAYYCKEGKVPGGVSDTGEGSADKSLFENLAGDGGSSGLENNVKYAKATVTVNVPRAAQMGFTKKVKGAADIGYSASTTVPATGDYTYQMRFALQDKAKAKSVVLYDVLETAYDDNLHWSGSFKGIDVTQIKRQYPDIDLKIYYSTSSEFGDLQATSGIDYTDLGNTNLWSVTAPDDLSTVTAVAVDISKNKDGSVAEFEGPIALSAIISMTSPANYEDYIDKPETTDVDETVYAYNQAFIKQGNEIPEGSETTTVAIKKPDIKIVKMSDPISGSASSPKKILAGSTIDYMLVVSNLNSADTITNVKVEDVIPDGLEIDAAKLAFYFGTQSGNKALADGSGRVRGTVDGQKVTFTVDKLAAKEDVKLIIPVKVSDDAAGGTRFDNKAKITEFNDEEWDDFESNETHHKTVSTEIKIPVKKIISGQVRPAAKAFSFVITGENGAPMPTNADGKLTITDEGTAYFEGISFTKPGDYKYTIKEEEGTDKGYTYDNTVHHITVHVTESNSVLSASWEDADAKNGNNGRVEFYNDYTPLSTKLAIPVEKILGGDPVPQGHTEDFEFILSAGAASNPMPADGKTKLVISGLDSSAAGKDKKSAFDSITFTEAGTYVYQIKETIGNTPGYQYAYDISTHTVTVKVTDVNGQLQCEWLKKDASGDNVTFKNNYEPTADIISLDVSKMITGSDRVEKYKKSFTFNLSQPIYEGSFDYAASGEELPMPTATSTSIVDNGNAQLGQIAIKHAGKYTYTITEAQENAAGYTYDAIACKAIVTAVDNGGEINCTIAYEKNGATVDNAQFTNNYKPSPASTSFTVNKTITGDVPADNQKTFTFKVEPVDGAPMPADGKDTIEITGEGSGTLENVGPFDKSGTYVYNIYEMPGDDHGYSYSEDKYKVTVTVTDEDGVLKAKQAVTKNGETVTSMDFENKYEPTPVNYVPLVTKITNGNDRPENQKKAFTFVLEGTGDAPMPEGNGNQAVITDQGDGTFGSINYTKAGEYQYKITENNDYATGYTYSDNECTLTVKVTDNEGVLGLTAAYVNTKAANTAAAEFTNTYKPEPVVHAIEVKKTITGNARPEGGEKTFTFILTPVDDAPMSDTAVDGQEKIMITDEGTAEFSSIAYTAVGTYKYQVLEETGNENGYVYSDNVCDVTVKVTDNQGVLEKEVTYKNSDDTEKTFNESDIKDANGVAPKVEFVNEYHPATVEAVFPITKTITGNARTDENKKDFTFTLKGKDGAPMPVDSEAVDTATTVINDEGTADFGIITYDEAGTFVYEITENKGDANSYTYSEDVYEVVVTVTDNNGTLEKEVVYSKAGEEVDTMSFENEYHPDKAVFELPIRKVVKGAAPAASETYSFVLEPKDGAPMPEKDTLEITGAGEGAFGAISYNNIGTYFYTVTETAGNAKNCTYDNTVYEIEVTVTDKDGELDAEWTANRKTSEAVEFINTYNADESNTPGGNDSNKNGTGKKAGVSGILTGDYNHIILWILLVVLAAASVVTVVVVRRRKK